MVQLMPPEYDLLWSLAAVVHLALLATALTLWFRARHVSAGGLLELLVIVLLPVIGPAAYVLAHVAFRRAAAPPEHTIG